MWQHRGQSLQSMTALLLWWWWSCRMYSTTHTRTHTPFHGPFSGNTQVSRYQKGKTNLDFLLKQETVSGSGISWAICKSAPRSRQITTPAPDHSVFYRPDALPAAQPTASKHWRYNKMNRYEFICGVDSFAGICRQTSEWYSSVQQASRSRQWETRLKASE